VSDTISARSPNDPRAPGMTRWLLTTFSVV